MVKLMYISEQRIMDGYAGQRQLLRDRILEHVAFGTTGPGKPSGATQVRQWTGQLNDLIDEFETYVRAIAQAELFPASEHTRRNVSMALSDLDELLRVSNHAVPNPMHLYRLGPYRLIDHEADQILDFRATHFLVGMGDFRVIGNYQTACSNGEAASMPEHVLRVTTEQRSPGRRRVELMPCPSVVQALLLEE